ncbi:uncharacterized protein LOC135398712 [Ornithodoros turicata]|uniref:uncharacterized protein LOC135398712 n=1 Tax=Ornithodoros turicata TaxID=34597 RepID=UPI003139247A
MAGYDQWAVPSASGVSRNELYQQPYQDPYAQQPLDGSRHQLYQAPYQDPFADPYAQQGPSGSHHQLYQAPYQDQYADAQGYDPGFSYQPSRQPSYGAMYVDPNAYYEDPYGQQLQPEMRAVPVYPQEAYPPLQQPPEQGTQAYFAGEPGGGDGTTSASPYKAMAEEPPRRDCFMLVMLGFIIVVISIAALVIFYALGGFASKKTTATNEVEGFFVSGRDTAPFDQTEMTHRTQKPWTRATRATMTPATQAP